MTQDVVRGGRRKRTSRNSSWGRNGVGAPIMAESYLRDQTELSYPPDAFADWRTAV